MLHTLQHITYDITVTGATLTLQIFSMDERFRRTTGAKIFKTAYEEVLSYSMPMIGDKCIFLRGDNREMDERKISKLCHSEVQALAKEYLIIKSLEEWDTSCPIWSTPENKTFFD